MANEPMMGFTNLGAGWVLWVLAGLSILSITVVLERALHLWRSRDDWPRLRRDVEGLLRAGRLADAARRVATSPSFEARIVAAGLDASSAGFTAVEARLEGATEQARLAMERRLVVLATIGNNAPFVGLLGTVIGVIRAFHELTRGSGEVSAGLMASIGDALATTAVGIAVALPAVAAFNAFQRIIRARLGRARSLGREVIAALATVQPAATVVPLTRRAS